MANMSPEEEPKVTAIRAALLAAEAALQDATQLTTDLMQIQNAAGRYKAKNKAFRFVGRFRALRGMIEEAHADAADALDSSVDNAGPVILAPGR